MSDAPEDELRTSIIWPYQVDTMLARRAWRVAVYEAGHTSTHAFAAHEKYCDGSRGALSAPRWVNRVLAATAYAMPSVDGMTVVLAAARVLRDHGLCLEVRSAWALGGIEAAAGVVKREPYPIAQDSGHEEHRAETR